MCQDLHDQAKLAQDQQQQQLERLAPGKQAPEITVDTLFNFIPAVCFVRLLKIIPQSVLNGMYRGVIIFNTLLINCLTK